MHKPESVPENETHKTFGGFEIKMDHRIPDLVMINQTKEEREREREREREYLPNSGLCRPGGPKK